jgi:hypothetical protein
VPDGFTGLPIAGGLTPPGTCGVLAASFFQNAKLGIDHLPSL